MALPLMLLCQQLQWGDYKLDVPLDITIPVRFDWRNGILYFSVDNIFGGIEPTPTPLPRTVPCQTTGLYIYCVCVYVARTI